MSTKKISNWMLIGGVGATAAAFWFADPKRGAARRAAFVRGAGTLMEKARSEGEKTVRDLQNQVSGLAARMRSHVEPGDSSDNVIEARLRSRLGRLAAHVRRVRVLCDHGVVTLWGPVYDYEVASVLDAARSTPGVVEVQDHLEAFSPEDPASPLAKLPMHHEDPLRRARRNVRLNWSPTKRLAVGAAGAAMAAYGIKNWKQGAAGKALAVGGAGMLVAGTLRNTLKDTLALTEESPGFEIERIIKINAPISDLYDFWADPENYPGALSHVARIDRLGENLFRWTVNGPAGLPVVWEGMITRAIPNTLVEWKSLPGATVGNFGIVRFHPDYDATTRVHIRMFYRPPAGILGRFLAELLGADAEDILDQDLRRLKEVFESGSYITEERKRKREQADLLRTATT